MTINAKQPEDDEQMLRKLATEANIEENMVGTVLLKIKMQETYEQNLKSLGSFKLEDLKKAS